MHNFKLRCSEGNEMEKKKKIRRARKYPAIYTTKVSVFSSLECWMAVQIISTRCIVVRSSLCIVCSSWDWSCNLKAYIIFHLAFIYFIIIRSFLKHSAFYVLNTVRNAWKLKKEYPPSHLCYSYYFVHLKCFCSN